MDGRSTLRSLFDTALADGSQALDVDQPAIAVGAEADIIALATRLNLYGDKTIDRLVVTGGRRDIDPVWRAGKRVVADRRSVGRPEIETHFEAIVVRAGLAQSNSGSRVVDLISCIAKDELTSCSSATLVSFR